MLQAFIDFDAPEASRNEALTATEILIEAGIDRPTSQQVKEGAALLREHLGAPKRIRGRDKYWFNRKPEQHLIDDEEGPDEEECDSMAADGHKPRKPNFS
ncbi:hypothetical protein [Novosphingobium sp. PhB55]|uniref:hypothetical protein n=1 Tax=Novosphingobium sp. PhB55 TaxID=2485106 RepID=UPI00106699E1|nr:hypothetical protein [Novosphingobium sp. PhB55]